MITTKGSKTFTDTGTWKSGFLPFFVTVWGYIKSIIILFRNCKCQRKNFVKTMNSSNAVVMHGHASNKGSLKALCSSCLEPH